MSMLLKLYELMAQKNASDIFISAGAPITIKINGTAGPVNPNVLSGEDTRKLFYDVLTPTQIERFEKDLELNLSKPMENIGNFRINMMYQKGTVAGVVRFISSNIPPIDSLQVPNVLKQVVMEKRGLILVVGATGSGKSTTL